MTEEHGISNLTIQDHAFNADDFVTFLKSLRRKYRKRSLALYMDQLKVHQAIVVKPYYDKLDIKPIFNVGYSPEFNPIEAVFSRVKFLFCNKRLSDTVNRTGFNFDRTIDYAFK